MAERVILGAVTEIDSRGNLVTNITAEMLADVPTGETTTVTCDEHETCGLFRNEADQPAMTLIALLGSRECLELAIVQDSAAMMLGVQAGTKVEVRW